MRPTAVLLALLYMWAAGCKPGAASAHLGRSVQPQGPRWTAIDEMETLMNINKAEQHEAKALRPSLTPPCMGNELRASTALSCYIGCFITAST